MSLSRVFILTILISCNALCSFSQKDKAGETFYAFDKDWKAISEIEKATTKNRKISALGTSRTGWKKSKKL